MDKRNILIVEDDPMIAESLQDILECLEHSVGHVADNAESALQFLSEARPDLIMLDIQLKGGMDGIALADLIKEKYNIPFIFTTAFADKESISRASDMGPFGYVVKPYGMEDIHAALEVALRNFNVLQQLKQSQTFYSTIKENHLYIKSDSRLIKVEDDKIQYVEARGDYVVFKTKTESYIVHSTLKNVESKLDSSKFLKVHRSFVINLDKIIDIEDSTVVIDQKVIPVSRAHRSDLMSRINLI